MASLNIIEGVRSIYSGMTRQLQHLGLGLNSARVISKVVLVAAGIMALYALTAAAYSYLRKKAPEENKPAPSKNLPNLKPVSDQSNTANYPLIPNADFATLSLENLSKNLILCNNFCDVEGFEKDANSPVSDNFSSTEFSDVFARAQKKGLQVYPVINFDLKQDNVNLSAQLQYPGLRIPAGSRVQMVCEQGFNRSQAMRFAALDECYETAVSLAKYIINPAHGAIGSVDPAIMPNWLNVTQDQVVVNDDERRLRLTEYPGFGELPPGELSFINKERQLRLGETETSPVFNEQIGQIVIIYPAVYKKARSDMDAILLDWLDKGVTLFVFNKAVHMMMLRLDLLAQKHQKTLQKVRLIPIKSDDQHTTGGEAPRRFDEQCKQVLDVAFGLKDLSKK